MCLLFCALLTLRATSLQGRECLHCYAFASAELLFYSRALLHVFLKSCSLQCTCLALNRSIKCLSRQDFQPLHSQLSGHSQDNRLICLFCARLRHKPHSPSWSNNV